MISGFEQFSKHDQNDQTQEALTEARRERLVRLWKKYHFLGEPPIKNSPVEKRLFDACHAYMQHVISPELYKDPMRVTNGSLVAENSEDYFAPMRYAKREQKSPSETDRRELHNQIALMVTGKQRSGMTIASEYVYDCDTAEAERLYRKVD